MPSTTPLLNRQRVRLAALIFALLSGAALIFYSGRIESGDSLRIFDAASSLVDHGDWYLDQAARQFPPAYFDESIRLPLQTANVEPLQVLTSAPLYALAKFVPGIGLVHTVWLTNVFIGAAAGVVFFFYALALGFRDATAVAGGLLLGLCTALFPYTKTFFREPLLLLLLLVTGLGIERLRASRYRSRLALAAAVLGMVGMTLTKASSLLALPALLVLTLPPIGRFNRRRARRWIILGGGGLMIVAAIFLAFAVFDIVPGLSARYNPFNRLREADLTHFWTAIRAYLFSPGGSIWGTSPVLLLAVPGLWLMARRGAWRYALAIPLLIAVFAAGYAVLNGDHWYGGLSWPPRFLLPVIGLALIGALPILDMLLRRPAGWLALGALVVYSLWVQISGALLPWEAYAKALPPESNGLLDWSGGLYDPQYFRWVVIPQIAPYTPLDAAWAHPGMRASGVPLFFSALIIFCLVLLVILLRRPDARAGRAAGLALPLLLLGLWGMLRAYHDTDSRYLATDDTLQRMMPIIEAETTADDVLLLSSPRYEPFFANYEKLNDAARWIVLPLQPGEQPSPEQPPEVRAENPDALLTRETIPLIHNLAATHQRLWLLVHGGPDLWWTTRPVERFMSAHYYPIRVIQTGPVTRLIEYSTVSAPDVYAFRSAERTTDLSFGDHIRLIGFELSVGERYRAGDALPVSLYWATHAPLEANYTVALFLRAADGRPAAQHDSMPGGGFALTSLWQPDQPVWDHRALRLPNDLAAGDYQLWVKVYDFGADGAPRDLPVTSAGDRTLDGVIGVLPVTIHVEAG